MSDGEWAPGGPTTPQKLPFEDLLERFGTNPAAFLLRYDAPWETYWGKRVEGAIRYVERAGVALGWSDPLCAPEDAGDLVEEFTAAQRARKLRVCLLFLEEASARHAHARGHAVIKVGEEPTFDLRTWRPPRGDRGKRLRWSLNRARRAGVEIREYRAGLGRDQAIESELRAVQSQWERSLGRKPIRSFLGTDPMAIAEEKRFFLAVADGRIEGFLACSPVPPRGGWFLEDLVRRPFAPTGTTESLVVESVDRLGRQGARFASLGIAPLRGYRDQLDPRARWLIPAFKVGFVYFDRRYRFASLAHYKGKFHPTTWEPRYVSVYPPRPSVALLRSVRSILDPGAVETMEAGAT